MLPMSQKLEKEQTLAKSEESGAKSRRYLISPKTLCTGINILLQFRKHSLQLREGENVHHPRSLECTETVPGWLKLHGI